MTMQVAKQEKTNALCPITTIPDHTTMTVFGFDAETRRLSQTSSLEAAACASLVPSPGLSTNSPGLRRDDASMEQLPL